MITDFNSCSKIIEEAVKAIDMPAKPIGLYEPIRYIMDIGGKRLRPALVLMAHSMFDNNAQAAINQAIGLELFHNFTLLHDDVMDNADMRRGVATVHKKWDVNTAILSGDAMMIQSYMLMSKCNDSVLREALELFNITALEVCEGQQYDMNFETTENVSIEDYLEMIRLKTSVLIAASLKMGGITAGASEQNKKLLYELGENIGLAFQLQDDYLDVFANQAKFGKTIGGDIVNNKKTYLLISALNKANTAQRAELEKWIKAKEFDRNKKVEAITNLYLELGIDKHTKAKETEYLDLGLSKLDKISIDKSRKSGLQDLVNLLAGRDK